MTDLTNAEIERQRAALKKLFYRHPPLPARTDEEYEMIRPLISESSPTPETEPPLFDALPGCLFRWCPTLDKCKTGGCATPWAKGPVSAPGEPDET